MISSPLLPSIANLIDGEWRDGSCDALLEVANPLDGSLLATLRPCSAEDACQAIAAAEKAMSAPVPIAVRHCWLEAMREQLAQNRSELARIITLEQGKPLREAEAEVDYTIGFFRFFAENMDHLEPEKVEVKGNPNQWKVYYRPTGVAVLITPWNFPLAMFGKKFAAALAAGCGIVSKPASQTPLTAIAIHVLAERARVPAERINLVIGSGGVLGPALCGHPSVRIVSCTGSTETGRELLRLSAAHVKRVALELGGNAPFIVLEDADLDLAVNSLMANKFRCGGQTCVCANRILAHSSILEAFRAKLIERMSNLVVGDGLQAETDIGPLIDKAAVRKVEQLVADAISRGAVKTFGEDPSQTQKKGANFYPPTILEGIDKSMALFHEEIFGPVVAIASFNTDDEAVAMANDTIYGLAGYLHTADRQRAEAIIEQLRCGHVGFNTGSGPIPDTPFGGMKQSGIGREGGLEGLFEYVEPQTVATGA